ncbi:MAG: hypothetical protein Ct9H300mP25_03880 [Acidobacteriota bacterium]|nr:MAG: hypothetical protein Ct9H300mP25_03880 [Acidobacteriota bacterium]
MKATGQRRNSTFEFLSATAQNAAASSDFVRQAARLIKHQLIMESVVYKGQQRANFCFDTC